MQVSTTSKTSLSSLTLIQPKLPSMITTSLLCLFLSTYRLTQSSRSLSQGEMELLLQLEARLASILPWSTIKWRTQLLLMLELFRTWMTVLLTLQRLFSSQPEAFYTSNTKKAAQNGQLISTLPTLPKRPLATSSTKKKRIARFTISQPSGSSPIQRK